MVVVGKGYMRHWLCGDGVGGGIVSHAAGSCGVGHAAWEQTFFVPVDSFLKPFKQHRMHDAETQCSMVQYMQGVWLERRSQTGNAIQAGWIFLCESCTWNRVFYAVLDWLTAYCVRNLGSLSNSSLTCSWC